MFPFILLKEYPNTRIMASIPNFSDIPQGRPGQAFVAVRVSQSVTRQRNQRVESHGTEISACDFYLCSLEKYLMSDSCKP